MLTFFSAFYWISYLKVIKSISVSNIHMVAQCSNLLISTYPGVLLDVNFKTYLLQFLIISI